MFGVSGIHTILTNPAYAGEGTFNKRSSKTLQDKPAAEHITFDVPSIIDRKLFDGIQSQLQARNPRAVAPRIVTGPILLTGLARCATCTGAMTLRTGTSKSGAIHKYYTCSTSAKQGKVACEGRSIQINKLDVLVVEHLKDRLFQPERLTQLLGSLVKLRTERAGEIDGRITRLQTDIADAEAKLRRVYKMVEDGLTKVDAILKERIAALQHDRNWATASMDRIRETRVAPIHFDPELLERFGRMMRDNITGGDVPFRKAYLQSVIERVEIDDHIIRIIGDAAKLQDVIAGGALAAEGVQRTVPKWRITQNKTANTYVIEIEL